MKKGFTLVELLAVIVILAIILAIAIPNISNIIKNVKNEAFKSDVKMIIKAIDHKKLIDGTFDPTTINETNVESSLGISNSNYERLTIKEANGKVYVTIVGKDKWSNITVSGTKTGAKIDDTIVDLVRGANAPMLVTGMTPVKWNGSAWVTTTSDDVEWYNYDATNKIWANAQTADGSFWVWIPRYIYKISTGWHTNTTGVIDIQFTKGVDDNWNKSVIGTINVGETANASNNTWTNHPAFTFGDIELTGIWVAKYEASNDGSNNVKIIPNVASWRNMNVETIFDKARSMEITSVYGWGTNGNGIDTHMMKNTEWGAVAYLSQSKYGKNTEVWVNPADNFTTGCAGTSATSIQTVGCTNTYSTANGLQASTTGNIYGIYDMSGGTWEYTAAYLNNGDCRLNEFGSNLIVADSKYKDVYTTGVPDNRTNNYTVTINHKGDAMYETSSSGDAWNGSWNGDGTYMSLTGTPWFNRGGEYSWNTGAGVFNFIDSYGAAANITFRPVLLINANL